MNARVDALIITLPEDDRYRWCSAVCCACLGCVNIHHKLPITEDEWMEWVELNPKPERHISAEDPFSVKHKVLPLP